jgi:dTDP-4-amino-4,6-dideoxygalactose transaminase
MQPALAGLGHAQGAFPVSETLAREILSLPIYPELSKDQVVRVAGLVGEFAASRVPHAPQV